MTAINTNVSSILARNALVANERSMSTSMERLSTGVRINSAKDDAAGLAIAAKQTSQIRGLDQAVRNANDAVSLIQTAEGALVETTNMLQRMRELAVQSASDTNVTSDRTALNTEFQQLKSEINRIASNTQWNGTNIIDKSFATGTGIFKFQVGANAAQTIDLTLGDYRSVGGGKGTTAVVTTKAAGVLNEAQTNTLTLGGVYEVGDTVSVNVGDKSLQYTVTAADLIGDTAAKDLLAIAISLQKALVSTGTTVATGVTAAVPDTAVITFTGSGQSGTAAGTPFQISASSSGLLGNIHDSTITSQSAANSAISALTVAVAAVNTGRSEMGATMNRLQYAADNLASVSANATESRGRILDTDYASETTELARTQIIAQAGTAMLAQANQMKQTVLSLLK